MPKTNLFVNCDCKTWRDNVRDVKYLPDDKSGLTITGSRTYYGVAIYFCPWCGKKLELG